MQVAEKLDWRGLNLKETDHLEDQGKCEYNTKSDLQETGWDGMHWIMWLIVVNSGGLL
jgi:hypothetical protein